MKTLQILVVISIGVTFISSVPVEQGKRLIKTAQEEPAKWMSEIEIWELIAAHQNFVDITDYPEQDVFVAPTNIETKEIPTTVRFQEQTKKVLNALNMDRIKDFVKEFSSFHNRYYMGDYGRESQQWLLAQVEETIAGYAGQASVKEFSHSWLQQSVIARIEGSDTTLKSEVVILGAHQDSINLRGSSLAAPGADDNAAGSVVVLESLRAIVDTGFIPKRTLEFHWYAGEEAGLLGSNAIAKDYKSRGVNVVGMVNVDVPGYQDQAINDVGIYTDYANAALTQFMRILVDAYLDYGRRDARCGYGCSDHASWNSNGFPATMPSEITLHPGMHTDRDTYESVGFTQVMEFTKLGASAMVEFGEPSQ